MAFRVRQFDDNSARGGPALLLCRPQDGRSKDKMSPFKHLTAVILAGILFMPPLPLAGRTRKGENLLKDSRAEQLKGNLDQALKLAEQALDEDRSDPAYQLQVRKLRFEDAAMHLKNGQKLRDAGKLDEALPEFEKAYGIDPASDIAIQEIKRTKEMIERNKKAASTPGAAKEDEKALTPSQFAHKQSQDRTDLLLPLAELQPLNTDLIDLKMMNRPRVLFETVAKVAGINVLFDPEYDQQQTIRTQSIDLTRTTLDQALDQIAVVTKSFWKPLSPNTIFVTVDNPTKRREYAEQVVKVFYLSNVTAPQEMQEMLTVLRTVVDVQKVFSFTSQNALIVRAEADTMALVEKLISDLDKSRPEVIIDVMVMTASSTHIRNITAAFAPTGVSTKAIFAPRPGITTPGIQQATTDTSTTSTTSNSSNSSNSNVGNPTSTNIPLNGLGRISSADYSLTNLPGAALEAVLNDTGTRVLQSPQIRAVDNVKASLKIGDKVPTATGSFQPGIGGIGAGNALVNTQFTFLDVGVNIEILPKVHDNNEVSLHLDIDVSQVKDRIDLGGVLEPEISQNKATADIRLREGEVNLIGGIIQQTDSKQTSGIPGLGTIPVLGRLFSGEKIQKDRTELVIALIPHIVRGPDISESNLRGVSAGNATQIKVAFGPRKGAPGGPAQATLVNPPGAAPAAPPATAPPATAPPIGPPATAPPNPNPAPAGGGLARISFLPGTVDTQLSAAVPITISAENISDMVAAAAQLKYDPRILRINNIVAGDLAQRSLVQPGQLEPSKNILNDTGQADMSVNRGPNDGGVSGSGGLFTVVFQAVGRGNTSISVSSVSLTSSTGQPINATAPPALVVNVK
jgi:general secretion pathway protein D